MSLILKNFRKNLFLEVTKKTHSVNVDTAFKHDLFPLLKEDKKLGLYFGGPTIIYCQRRNDVDLLAQYLRSLFIFLNTLLMQNFRSWCTMC